MIGKKIFSLLGTIAINSKSAIAEIKAVEATGGRMATKLSSAWTKMGKVMKVAAVVAVAAAGAAVVGFAKSAISEFVKIEEAAGQVFTLLPGLSEEAKDEMLADVMDVSREFGFLPDKVLPALYQALSAGVPKENVFEYMRVASEMAVGGAVELEVAVLSLAQVMNAYGADVSEVRDYSDQFFSIVADGITTIEELSGHLFKIAPVAADVGVKFRDVAGWLAELTAQGTPTAEAATYIRGALNELSKAGMQAFVAFEKAAGQTFPDFIKAGGSVADAVKILEDYANETGVSVKDLFGSIEGGAAVLGITGEKFDSFAQKVENAGSAAGKTADAFVEMAATLRKKLDRLAAWWATLKWKIGAKLEEPFEKLLTFLEDNQEAFEDFVTNVFEKIVDALKWILENGDTVKVIFQGIGAAIATIATAKIISLIASLNALGLTIVAIAGAGLLGPYLADIYDAISEGISSVADETTKLKHVTDAVAGVFIEIIQGVEAAVKQSVWNIYQEGKASAAQIEAVALALAKAGEEATAALREGVRYDEALESFGAMVDEILTQYGLIDEVSTETYQGIVDAAVQAWKEVEDSGDALALTAGRVLQTWEELSDGVEEGAERQGVAMQMHIDALDATRAALAEWRAEQQAAGEDVEVLEEDISELQQELIDLEEALAGTEKGSYKYVMALKDLEAYHEKVSAAAEYLEDRNIEVNATLGLLIDATSQYGEETEALSSRIQELQAEYDSWNKQLTTATRGSFKHKQAVEGLRSIYAELSEALEWAAENGYTVDKQMIILMDDIEGLNIIVEESVTQITTWEEAWASLEERLMTTAERLESEARTMFGAIETAWKSVLSGVSTMAGQNIKAIEDYKAAVETIETDHTVTLEDLVKERDEKQIELAKERQEALQKIAEDETLTAEDAAKQRLKIEEDYAEKAKQVQIDYAEAVNQAADERTTALEDEGEAYEENRVTIKGILKQGALDFINALKNKILAQSAATGAILVMQLLAGDLSAIAKGIALGVKTAAALVGLDLIGSGVQQWKKGAWTEGRQPVYGVMGEGPYTEMALPLSPPVFDEMAEGLMRAAERLQSPVMASSPASINVEITGNNFYVRDEQEMGDVSRSLAEEIADNLKSLGLAGATA